MTKHRTGTRKEWLAARLELLQAEKEHTRRGDELASYCRSSGSSPTKQRPCQKAHPFAALLE